MFKPPSQAFLGSCPYPVFAMNLQVRGYSQQYFLSGMRTLTLDYQMTFRGTTLLNSSPLLVWRHVKRKTPSKSRFSLSPTFASARGPVIPPEFIGPRTGAYLIFKELKLSYIINIPYFESLVKGLFLLFVLFLFLFLLLYGCKILT